MGCAFAVTATRLGVKRLLVQRRTLP